MLKFNQTSRTSVKFDVHDDGAYETEHGWVEISNDKNHDARLLAVSTTGFAILVVVLFWVGGVKMTPKMSHLIRGPKSF